MKMANAITRRAAPVLLALLTFSATALAQTPQPGPDGPPIGFGQVLFRNGASVDTPGRGVICVHPAQKYGETVGHEILTVKGLAPNSTVRFVTTSVPVVRFSPEIKGGGDEFKEVSADGEGTVTIDLFGHRTGLEVINVFNKG